MPTPPGRRGLSSLGLPSLLTRQPLEVAYAETVVGPLLVEDGAQALPVAHLEHLLQARPGGPVEPLLLLVGYERRCQTMAVNGSISPSTQRRNHESCTKTR